MSAIAVLAALAKAAIKGDWTAKALAADFVYAALLLLLPGIVRP